MILNSFDSMLFSNLVFPRLFYHRLTLQNENDFFLSRQVLQMDNFMDGKLLLNPGKIEQQHAQIIRIVFLS